MTEPVQAVLPETRREASGTPPNPSARGAAAGPSRRYLVANLVAFQLCWFACVLGAARGWPWLGTASVALMVVWHLSVVARPALEARLVACAVAFGFVFDALLLATGSVGFPNGFWLEGFGPHWMLALWALFAVTLNVSLRWLKGRRVLAIVLGAVSGPMSFVGGAKLGGATLIDPKLAIACLAVGWAVALPTLVWLGERFDGVAARSTREPE